MRDLWEPFDEAFHPLPDIERSPRPARADGPPPVGTVRRSAMGLWESFDANRLDLWEVFDAIAELPMGSVRP